MELTDKMGVIRALVEHKDNIKDFGEIKAYIDRLYTEESRIRCKDCKYYHEDFWGEIEGLPEPTIIAHQICSKWGGGCKTLENGYCHFGEARGEE